MTDKDNSQNTKTSIVNFCTTPWMKQNVLQDLEKAGNLVFVTEKAERF